MKKVAHVIIGLGRGGAERALTRLVEAQLGSAEYEHFVISLTDMGRYGEQLQQKGVKVLALGMRGFGLAPLTLLKLIKILRELKPDLVQTWMYHADLLGGLAARLAGSPPVLWGIRSFDLKRGAKRSTRIVQRLCALTSSWLPTLILCVAEASRKNHIALGYDERRMVVIPNGFESGSLAVSDDDVIALRDHCGLGPQHLVVGCVGRFHPAKDHENFVSAAALLRDEFSDVHFMMVGPGLDSSNKLLTSWIDNCGMRSRFLLLGERTDIPRCMAAMDVFCSSSRTEAFPQVVGEAMMMARPVVVTDVGDTAFVVGETGVVVERENARALADGLASMLSEPETVRAARGRLAHARILNEFSLKRTVWLTLNAYELALRAVDNVKGGR